MLQLQHQILAITTFQCCSGEGNPTIFWLSVKWTLKNIIASGKLIHKMSRNSKTFGCIYNQNRIPRHRLQGMTLEHIQSSKGSQHCIIMKIWNNFETMKMHFILFWYVSNTSWPSKMPSYQPNYWRKWKVTPSKILQRFYTANKYLLTKVTPTPKQATCYLSSWKKLKLFFRIS